MKEFKINDDFKVINGSNLDVLPTLEENSIDAIVCDPPYELGFMGKKWDSTGIAYNVELWKQALRVLKPGGHLLAFGGSRTYHRIACAIEDAGFEIRDCLMWLYGSGFPKSHNIGLAVDELNGVESKVVGNGKSGGADTHTRCMNSLTKDNKEVFGGDYEIKEAQNEWKGFGTALKPGYEPIVMARKPIAEKSIAENCLKWGVGGINIDECRVKFGKETDSRIGTDAVNTSKCGFWQKDGNNGSTQMYKDNGRFPANIITDGSDEVAQGFPMGATTGHRSQQSINNCIQARKNKKGNSQCDVGGNIDHITEYTDSGSTMRYFYTAKASKKDRDDGLDKFEAVNMRIEQNRGIHSAGCEYIENGKLKQNPHLQSSIKKNFHPTVKPVELMQYLVRLVAPKGSTILDIFNGSGSTGKAVAFENRERDAHYKYIGIELEEQYCEISVSRIDYGLNKFQYDMVKDIKDEEERTGQLNLFDI